MLKVENISKIYDGKGVAFPMDNEVVISAVKQTFFNHFVGGIANKLFVDVFCKCVPRVPAHRRCCDMHNKKPPEIYALIIAFPRVFLQWF